MATHNRSRRDPLLQTDEQDITPNTGNRESFGRKFFVDTDLVADQRCSTVIDDSSQQNR
jgi:hypothetical protein